MPTARRGRFISIRGCLGGGPPSSSDPWSTSKTTAIPWPSVGLSVRGRHYAALMGDVVGMTGEPIDPLQENLRQSFYKFGQARATIDALGIPLTEWRKAARAVARDLGRPVQTLVGGDQVHAVLTDWPADDRESAVHRAQLRAAVVAAAAN